MEKDVVEVPVADLTAEYTCPMHPEIRSSLSPPSSPSSSGLSMAPNRRWRMHW